MAAQQAVAPVLYPHPLLATRDDGDYIRAIIGRMPAVCAVLFDSVRDMIDATDALHALDSDVSHQQLEGGFGGGGQRLQLEGLVEELRFKAEVMHAEMRRYATVLATVPPGSFLSTQDRTPLLALDECLQKVVYLWGGDVIKVNEKTVSWGRPAQKLADDSARLVESALIEFPLGRRFARRLVDRQSLTPKVLLLLHVVSVFCLCVASVAFHILEGHELYSKAILAALALVAFVTMVLVSLGYQHCLVSLDTLYRDVFLSKLSYSESKMSFADGLVAVQMDRDDGLASTTGSSSSTRIARKLSNRNTNQNHSPLAPPLLDGSHSARGGAAANPLGQSDGAAFNAFPSPQDAALRSFHFPIVFGEAVAYVDARYVDAQMVMIGFDSRQRVTMWNAAAEAVTGFLEAECIGKPLLELIEPPYPDLGPLLSGTQFQTAVKVQLKAFATSSIAMYTIVAPVISERMLVAGQVQQQQGGVQRSSLGHVLICATGRDNLMDARQYISNYWRFQITSNLQRTLTTGSFAPDDRGALVSVLDFVKRGSAKQLEEVAKAMVNDWEWTTGQQLLSRGLSSHLSRVTTSPLDRNFPSSLCINLNIATIVDTLLGTCDGHCTVSVEVLQELASKICVLTATLRLDTAGAAGGHSSRGATTVTVPRTSTMRPSIGSTPSLNSSAHPDDDRSHPAEPAAAAASVIVDHLDAQQRPQFDVARILGHHTLIQRLHAAFGMVSFQEGETVAVVTVPCQVAQQYGDLDTNGDDGMVDDLGVSTVYGAQINAAESAGITCTVNVMTMISNLVDQHNLSMVLLKTMFVSLTNTRNIRDLEKKIRATPCEVDVVVADKTNLWQVKGLLAEAKQQAAGVFLVPLLDSGAPTDATTPYVLRTPIERSAVQATLQEIGSMVAAKKRAQEQREERERILASRQDSPWTQGKLLGRGAFGAVYEAISDLTGGKMAVKMFYFKKTDENSEETISVMLQEIKIMCDLNHPNIVHYFYCERHDNNLNLFMELCDGSLSDLLMSKNPTAAAAAGGGTVSGANNLTAGAKDLSVNDIVLQVVRALVYLHDKGITHRDIKPHNILLKGDVIKMTDFGTARENKNEELHDVQGTFRYMAPEVYRGEPHSQSCDIWSLGCLVAELLGSTLNFMERRFSSMLGDMMDVTIPPSLKGEARDFVRQCLQVVPSARPKAAMLLLHPFLTNSHDTQMLLHFADAQNRPGKRSSIASRMSAFSLSSAATLPIKRQQ